MPTTLRMIVDQVVAPVSGALGRYTEALTASLIAAAPPGCEVEGVVSSSLPNDYELVLERLPGLAGLYKSSLARRELAAAWQFGLTTSPGGGMIHAPSLFAPLRRHNASAGVDQTVVTVHDLLAWTNPESLTPTTVAWHKAMMKRARKHADAVVVPTHALAERLALVADFGDRVRVIGTAPRLGLKLPRDAADRAARFALPGGYLVTAGSLDPGNGVGDLLEALGRDDSPDLPIIVLGPENWGEQHLATVAEEAGVSRGRVRALELDDPADLATVLSGATAFVAPSHDEGSGTSLIEAFSLGVPVIHSDTPAYVEVGAEAGRAVAVGGGAGYAERLAAAITAVVEDSELADRMSIAGTDRAQAFTWRDSAERVWQLHADL
ncbi:glycosyltransferase family 4 protein [Agromyces italicus]|uniref:glycosyltransferase family 4 protein n=1 Tax=Agromyces italicus TaxID=279572 RepID=UPI0004191395|nr:glycosyltransferase family 1 protein [Agromyces italicus]